MPGEPEALPYFQPNASSPRFNTSLPSKYQQNMSPAWTTHNFPQYLTYFAVLELIGLTVLTHLSHLVKLVLTVLIAVMQGCINTLIVRESLDYYDQRTYGVR